MIRRVAAFSVLAVLVAAALTVFAAALLTPGYDMLTTTISRLAVPGRPAAGAVDAAIAGAGLACFALAIATGAARATLALAGAGFAAAALVHLDPSSAIATSGHRAASAVAVTGLVLAPLQLARAYGRVSGMLGVLEAAILAAGGVLLFTPFPWWGAWERTLLAVALAWMVAIAARIAFTAATPRARTATVSSPGT